MKYVASGNQVLKDGAVLCDGDVAPETAATLLNEAYTLGYSRGSNIEETDTHLIRHFKSGNHKCSLADLRKITELLKSTPLPAHLIAAQTGITRSSVNVALFWLKFRGLAVQNNKVYTLRE